MARAKKKAVAELGQPATEAALPADTSFNPAEFDPAMKAVTVVQDVSTVPSAAELEATHENGHSARFAPHRQEGQSHAEAVVRAQPRGTPDPFGIAHDLLAGVRLSESRRYGKMLVAFDEKPSDEVRAKMNEAGFRWESLEKVWTRELRDNPMSVRIDAERLFNDVSKVIRSERGIEHSVGVTA